MPNHTATNLAVSGPKESVQKFLKISSDSKKEIDAPEFSFKYYLPMPEELADTTYPSSKNDEESQELNEKYGAPNWYEWCINNYGTKWDCYDVGEWNIVDCENGMYRASISYCTAWSPATNFYENISESFPDLEFVHEFADEGGSFVGNETIKDGEVVFFMQFDWDSEGGIAIRKRVGYWQEEDEEGAIEI